MKQGDTLRPIELAQPISGYEELILCAEALAGIKDQLYPNSVYVIKAEPVRLGSE